MSSNRSRVLSCVLALTIAPAYACGDDGPSAAPDAGTTSDGGAPSDGGHDAGETPDGGASPDVDSGTPTCDPSVRPPAPSTIFVDDLADGMRGSGTEADPFRDLQDAIDAAQSGDTIRVARGNYTAAPRDYVDPTCGNCADADFYADIPATVAYHVRCKEVHIAGEMRTSVVLRTGAGYGVLFENAGASSIEGLTVTGGRRDADGRATNAGIAARNTELTVHDVDVIGNDDLYTGEPDPVVGIAGIVGKEGAFLTITDSRILNNSWDGIALYRGAPDVVDSGPRARIANNQIGCTTGCTNPRGRGVGIGVTWDAQAEIVGNTVFRYWKGIGAFGDTRVVATNNIVVDQSGWGVIATENAMLDAINNVIAFNGTTGLAAWSGTSSGRFVNNVVVGNGWSADEWVGKRTGIWLNAPLRFEVAYNDVWNNEVEDVCTGGVPGGEACTPVALDAERGNVSVDPLFVDRTSFVLQATSPLIDAGDPSILDTDGTRSDMGAHGGPAARHD